MAEFSPMMQRYLETKEEYKDLKKELENIGYSLKIVHRRNIKKVQ